MYAVAIYNSRNYKCFIDIDVLKEHSFYIYNSRNYKCFIDATRTTSGLWRIYNSRNYKCFIDIFYRSFLIVSTIVEITNVL